MSTVHKHLEGMDWAMSEHDWLGALYEMALAAALKSRKQADVEAVEAARAWANWDHRAPTTNLVVRALRRLPPQRERDL
jgi:hypothetical protein